MGRESLPEVIPLQSTFVREAVTRHQTQPTEPKAIAQQVTGKAIASVKAKVEKAAKAMT